MHLSTFQCGIQKYQTMKDVKPSGGGCAAGEEARDLSSSSAFIATNFASWPAACCMPANLLHALSLCW